MKELQTEYIPSQLEDVPAHKAPPNWINDVARTSRDYITANSKGEISYMASDLDSIREVVKVSNNNNDFNNKKTYFTKNINLL